MKPFSANHKPINRARAKNAALLNLLATPGLGSLWCRRWIAGTSQLILSIAGTVLIFIWFFEEMSIYYGMMFGNASENLPGFKKLELGALLLAIAWVWSAFTSIRLIAEADAGNLQALKNFSAPPMLKLDSAKIALALASIPNWKQNGDSISRTFQFKDFPAAIKFVNTAAEIAEREWHHPDIDIRWNKVTLSLTTHDAGGLTEKDFSLAKKFDELSRL